MEELCQKPSYEDDILKGIWLPCACYKWLIKCFGSNRFLKEIGHRHYGCQNLTCLPKRKKIIRAVWAVSDVSSLLPIDLF